MKKTLLSGMILSTVLLSTSTLTNATVKIPIYNSHGRTGSFIILPIRSSDPKKPVRNNVTRTGVLTSSTGVARAINKILGKTN